MSNSATLTVTVDRTSGDLNDIFVNSNPLLAMSNMSNFITGVAGGAQAASITVVINDGNAANASADVTVSSPIAGDKLLINGVSFIAGSTFAIGGSDSATATNLANAINASANALIDGIVTASASNSTVTITAVSPGVVGNMITLEGQGTGGIDPDNSGAHASATLTCSGVAAADTAVVNGVTVTAVDKREKTQVTCIADTGAFEQTTITTVADTGVKERTTVTTVADAGAFEQVIVTVPATASAAQGDYFVLTNTAGATAALWLDIDAAGTVPTGAAYVAANSKVPVPILTGNTAAQNAAALVLAAASILNWTAVDNLNGTVTYTQTKVGNCTNAAKHNENDSGDGSFTFSGEVNGVASNLNSKYFTFSSANDDTNYYIWYNVNSEGVDPAPGGTGVEVAVAAGATDSTVASATRAKFALAPLSADFTESGATNQIIFTNDTIGATTNTADGGAATGFTIATTTAGVDSNLNSSYFTFSSANDATDYYIWYNVDSLGVDPAPGGTGVEVVLTSSATDSAVASATRAKFLLAPLSADFTESGATNQIIFVNKLVGVTTDTADGGAATGFTIVKDDDGAASNLNSKYFTFKSAANATSYYMWYNVNDEGVDPAPGGTGVEVAIAASASANDVASASRAEFLAAPLSADFIESGATDKILFQNKLVGATDNAADGGAATGFAFSTTIAGGSVGATEFQIDASNTTVATNLKTALNAQAGLSPIIVATSSNAIVTVTALEEGIEGNNITLAGTGGVTASGTRLSGGTDSGLVRLSGGVDNTSSTTYNIGR
jgi:hypothetical protein